MTWRDSSPTDYRLGYRGRPRLGKLRKMTVLRADTRTWSSLSGTDNDVDGVALARLLETVWDQALPGHEAAERNAMLRAVQKSMSGAKGQAGAGRRRS